MCCFECETFRGKKTDITPENSIGVHSAYLQDNALCCALRAGYIEIAKFLIQNGASISKTNALLTDQDDQTDWDRSIRGLKLISDYDRNGMKFLQIVTQMKPSLRPVQDVLFLWNLAMIMATKYRAIAFRLYFTIRSFITYKGVFVIV